jgi:hypothetical protein
MGIEFNRGFYVFDKSWFQENEFMHSLSHAEFRIMVYLLSSALKLSKRDTRFKRSKWLVDLYQNNHLLLVNVSQRTIADRCSADRKTVINTLKKFNEYGALLTISNGEEKGNNVYLIGFENPSQHKEGKQDYYLIDSIPIRSGGRLSEETINLIKGHYHDDMLCYSEKIWGDLFGMEIKAEPYAVAV